jgi:hypothetical protein
MNLTAHHHSDAQSIASIGPSLGGVVIDLASQSLGEIAAYVQALKDHDWHFDYTDDHSVYQRGHNSLARITRMQKLIDADGTLWNAHCPEAYRLHVVEV